MELREKIEALEKLGTQFNKVLSTLAIEQGYENGKVKKNAFQTETMEKMKADILDEIKKAGEITQDSLRFRLNWSKAKISTTLTNLDKMNLIQKERIGKTYKVYLQNEKK